MGMHEEVNSILRSNLSLSNDGNKQKNKKTEIYGRHKAGVMFEPMHCLVSG